MAGELQVADDLGTQQAVDIGSRGHLEAGPQLLGDAGTAHHVAALEHEKLWPGFKVSTAAYVNSLLRPEIIRDLELHRHGFELLPRNPSSFTPFPDGRYL